MKNLAYKQMIKEKLSELLETTDLSDDQLELVTLGFDSVKAIRFIVELEIMFDITVNDDELLLDNFATIERIEQLVSRKIGIEYQNSSA